MGRSSIPARGSARLLTAAFAGLVALAVWDLAALAKPPHAKKGVFEYGARVQKPQHFLERRAFMNGGALDLRKHSMAMRYLVERYGNVDDEATAKWNAQPAKAHAKTVHFMGLPISIHAKIAPALAAVEKRIIKQCTGHSRYTPKAIGGFRSQNTYRGVEISNHLLGIAIDIDPDRNPCCGCVDPWPSNPICKNPGTVYKRTALPKCWISAFERFGFDWLGHDTLEDTMHFEFLGDPDKITK
ncbi:MAG: M15 family metallopeptidase [Minicystis sp.]